MGLLLEPFVYVVALLLNLYFYVVFAEVILHWLVNFGIVDAKKSFMPRLISVLQILTKPVYEKIRSYVPIISGLDFSPFILMLILLFLERLLLRISQLLLG